jgi:hypothetical protein
MEFPNHIEAQFAFAVQNVVLSASAADNFIEIAFLHAICSRRNLIASMGWGGAIGK